MIKHIKTSKWEGLAVLVPDDADQIRITHNASWYMLSYRLPNAKPKPFGWKHIYLPDKSAYNIVATSTDITEEQAAEIVETSEYYDPHAQPYPIPCYKDYIDNVWKWEPSQSFSSLMHSIGAYSVNPFGEKEPEDISDLGTFTQMMRHKWALWKEAQKSVGTWVILKKI